jgi:hypothetical protein
MGLLMANLSYLNAGTYPVDNGNSLTFVTGLLL